MKTIEVFDPPMCCSTGVCGPVIDPVLPRFVADLHWLANQGVRVSRHNLSQEPQAFAANELVKAALATGGNNCLPLILVNGQVVSKGIYPDRRRLAQMMGIELVEAERSLPLPVIQSGG
jgi:arsenite methyltransferase